jgi:hypothetical protein
MNKQQKIDYAIKVMGNAAKCLRLGDSDKATCILAAESLETAIRQIK